MELSPKYVTEDAYDKINASLSVIDLHKDNLITTHELWDSLNQINQGHTEITIRESQPDASGDIFKVIMDISKKE